MRNKVNALVKTLVDRNLSVAFAESMTCGLAAHQLSTLKGTSEILKGSIVCYDEEVKIKLFGVKKSLIDKFSAESAQVTKELVNKLRRLIQADIHAAITGLSSPGGSETKNKPVGTVFICVSFRNKFYSYRKVFRGSPLEIRKKACVAVYEFIRKIVGT